MSTGRRRGASRPAAGPGEAEELGPAPVSRLAKELGVKPYLLRSMLDTLMIHEQVGVDRSTHPRLYEAKG